MEKAAFGTLVLVAIALAGCSTQANRPRPTCALAVTQICMAAAETRFTAGVRMTADALMTGDAFPAEERVVPYVVPVLQPNGSLAAEVDCYANTDFRTFSIVHSAVAIAPESPAAVDFLREQRLCTDQNPGTIARL